MKHVVRATARVQCRQPGAKTTEVEAPVATSGLCFYRPSTVGCSQAVQIWLNSLQVRAGHAWHEQHSLTPEIQIMILV